MLNYGAVVSKAVTPQSEPIPGSTQIQNNARGYAFALDDWKALERFLILGSEGGTYYVSERKLTRENAARVERCYGADPERTAAAIVAVSDTGRAPRNDAAVFALALGIALGGQARKAALAALPKVCRIPTHLFQLTEWTDQLHPGLGARSYRTALGKWYSEREPEQLAYHILKYQARGGWSHRDVLRVAHPKAIGQHGALLGYARAGLRGAEAYSLKVRTKAGEVERSYPANALELPRIVEGFERAKEPGADIPALVREYGLTHEMLPSESLALATTWEALLEKMPLHAMVRNLGRMTANGLIGPLSMAAGVVAQRLADEERIRKSRLHPMALLVALKTYAHGHGDKGKLSWSPVPPVIDALDGAFYLAFGNVEPTGKNVLYGLDVSGSMASPISGLPITCAEGVAVLSMALARAEKSYAIMAFDQGIRPLDISPKMRLDEVLRSASNINSGGTDCSLPYTWALQNRIDMDAAVVLTDNETWAGRIHPIQALNAYRRAFKPECRAVVVGMTATNVSINDPADALAMDVAGFDTSTPAVISDFIRG